MFIIILIIILAIFIVYSKHIDLFANSLSNLSSNSLSQPSQSYYVSKPYNPPISTPMHNYLEISNQIDSQQKYKSDLSVALQPTPTIQCQELTDKDNCNKYGCNWFGSFCSSMYPRDF